MQRFKAIRGFKLVLSAVLVVITLSITSGQIRSRAASPATYTVIAGGGEMQQPFELMAFWPQTLKVHRGDTVIWKIEGFHNIRFDVKPVPVVITSTIDGKTVQEANPTFVFANVKSGDPFKPGASSGLPFLGPNPTDSFSLVMNADPGTYNYLCDFHPGMVGTIVVVDDNTAIASPDDVDKQAQSDTATAADAGWKGYVQLDHSTALVQLSPRDKQGNQAIVLQPTGDTFNVMAGGMAGPADINHFFPPTAVIHAGQSVTWTVPQGLTAPTTITFPFTADTYAAASPTISMDSAKAPHAVFGPGVYTATAQSGADFPDDGKFSTGQLTTGQSFTLHFTKPGEYHYFNAFTQQMNGTVVVLPAQ